jgi:hypothetical protein
MEVIKDYIQTVEKKLLPRIERIEMEIASLREEWEILKNPELVRKIQESITQKRKKKLHSWDEFKKIVDGG